MPSIPGPATSSVPGAHGPHVPVSGAQNSNAQSQYFGAGMSAQEALLFKRRMERDSKMIDADWLRRQRAERKLYDSLLKSHKGMNEMLRNVKADSSKFWKQTAKDISRTMGDLSRTLSSSARDMTAKVDKHMDRLLAVSAQRQKKADDALRMATRSRDQAAIRRASYHSENEGRRMDLLSKQKVNQNLYRSKSRQKSVIEGRMSRGEALSVEEFREYEKLADDLRDLEKEMNKFVLVTKYMSKGITDVSQAARAADLELDHFNENAKTFSEVVSKMKVDIMEAALKTFTYAKAFSSLGDAIGIAGKHYKVMLDQAYKLNGVIDVSKLSFADLAKASVAFDLSSTKIRYWAATAGVSVEAVNALQEKLPAVYALMDSKGKFDGNRMETLSKELLLFSKKTGVSVDESLAMHVKLRKQMGMSEKQATSTLHTIMSEQIALRSATSSAFGDLAVMSDEFQKSIQGIIDSYSGFRLDVSGVTAMFAEQVKQASKMGMSFDQALSAAKGIMKVLEKPATIGEYKTGKAAIREINAALQRVGVEGITATKGMEDVDRLALSGKLASDARLKALGLDKDKIDSAIYAATHLSMANASTQVARQLEGTGFSQRETFERLKQEILSGRGDAYLRSEISDMTPEMQESIRLMRLQISEAKRSKEQTPKAEPDKTPLDIQNILSQIKGFFNDTALGKLVTAAGAFAVALGMHASAMTAHTFALLKDAAGKFPILNKLMSKIPGVGGKMRGMTTGGIAGELGEGAAETAGAGVAKNSGRLARVLPKLGKMGKYGALAALVAGGSYGLYKWLSPDKSKPGEATSEPTTDADQQRLANESLKSSKDTVSGISNVTDEQKETNRKLDQLNDSIAKQTKERRGMSSDGMPSATAVAASGLAIGAPAAYWAAKKLLKNRAEKAAAEAATQTGEHIVGKAAREATESGLEAVGKVAAKRGAASTGNAIPVVGPLIGAALTYAFTDGPAMRKLSAAIGDAVGAAGGELLGSLAGPVGTIGGGIAGGLGGTYLGENLYDWVTGYKSPDEAAATEKQEAPAAEMPQLGQAPSAMDTTLLAESMPALGTSPLLTAADLRGGAVGVQGAQVSSGTGLGRILSTDRNGTAVIQATLTVNGFDSAVTSVLRDSYNMQTGQSGISRKGVGAIAY